MQSTVLDNIFSSSATIHLIKELYGDTFVCIAKKIHVPPVEVMKWRLSHKQIGSINYEKLIKVYPDLKGKIDYMGNYKG